MAKKKQPEIPTYEQQVVQNEQSFKVLLKKFDEPLLTKFVHVL